MNKSLLLWSFLFVLSGCAPAKTLSQPPAPVAAEKPCRCWGCWLNVELPQHWVERTTFDCSRADFFHRLTAAFAEVILFDDPGQGSLPAAVAVFRQEMENLGYEVPEDPVFREDPRGRQTASLRYRGTKDQSHLRGKITFRYSKTPGAILTFYGLWHDINDADALAAFDDLVGHTDDLAPRE